MPAGDTLMDILAAKYAQESLDLLNQAGPWPSDGMVPESQRLTLPYDTLVEVGYSLPSKEAE